MDSSKQQAQPPRQAVLVVCNSDGWVEVYAEKNIDVHIAQRPYVDTLEGERAADEYLDETLPWRYRDLYWPGRRRAADMVSTVRPSDIAQRDWQMDMLKAIGKLELLKEDRRVWTF